MDGLIKMDRSMNDGKTGVWLTYCRTSRWVDSGPDQDGQL